MFTAFFFLIQNDRLMIPVGSKGIDAALLTQSVPH